jgi:hypothetical protein
MRRSIIRPMLAAALFSLAMRAQAQQRSLVGQVDFGITYAAGYSNYVPTTTFWMQGGSIELAGHIPHGLAVVADITGLHEGGSGSSGVPINLVTDTFGPRYTRVIATRARKHPIALFGQALIGEAHGFSSVFPGPSGASTDALSFALQVGGGTDRQIGCGPSFPTPAATFRTTSASPLASSFTPGPASSRSRNHERATHP